MTAPTDPDIDVTRAFVNALPEHVRRVFTISPMVHVPMIHAATTRGGWTPRQLAKECATGIIAGTLNTPEIVTRRLSECANGKIPPAASSRRTFTQPLPWCGDEWCEENGRWQLEPETGQRLRHCPTCYTTPPA